MWQGLVFGAVGLFEPGIETGLGFVVEAFDPLGRQFALVCLLADLFVEIGVVETDCRRVLGKGTGVLEKACVQRGVSSAFGLEDRAQIGTAIAADQEIGGMQAELITVEFLGFCHVDRDLARVVARGAGAVAAAEGTAAGAYPKLLRRLPAFEGETNVAAMTSP